MFKKKIVALFTCFFVASTAMATNAYAIKSKELATTKQTIDSREVEGMLVTDGYVAQKSGDYIAVIGEAVEGANNKIILNIDDKTAIVDTRGNKLSKDKIKNGSAVEVVYEEKETNSVIPFVTAKKVIVKKGIGREGTVLEIRESSNRNYYLTIEENEEDYESEYTLIIGQSTELVDIDGDKLTINDIEEGMNIVGIHSTSSTKSIPPQSRVYKIIVMEDIKENKHIVEGMVDVIVDLDNEIESDKEKFLTVLGKGETDNTDGNLNIFITKRTDIRNENGVKVSLEKIKHGSVVEVVYNTKATDDDQVALDAEKIIVKNSIGIKGDILEINDYEDNGSILVEDNEHTNSDSQMVLNFRENTEILDIKGNKLSLYDLNQGMEIVGIHSRTSTKSIPPQSQAYTVIVTSEVKETKQAVEGMIYNIPNSNKKRISVVGESLTENAPNFVDLYINNNTEIVNEQGEELDLREIKEGAAIQAVFGQRLTKSSIPVGTASKIVIKKAAGVKGEIINTNLGKNSIEIKNSDKYLDNIILKINDNTEIVDLEGKKLNKYDLSKGAKVIGIHSLVSTKSIPAQTVAYKIIVLEKAELEDKYIVEGMVYKISNYSKKKISIVGEALTENAPNFVDLYINNDTEIVNEEGDKLDLDDLKEDMAIQAIFGRKLTKSTIPIGTAEKIVIKNALGVKGEISSTNDKKTYIEIKKSDYLYDSIVLKINNNTEIVDIDGNELSKDELTKGAKVIGIHSLAIKESMPPQTLAYKIIVLEKAEVENKHIVEGMVYKVRDDYKTRISIMGEALTKNAPNFVDLYINDDTEIVNEQGKKLDLDGIKEQSVVKAIFGQRLTKSTIPIGTAEKIIVKNAVGIKGEIINTNNDRTLIEIEKSDDVYYNTVLKINDNTEIIDINGEELSKSDLNEGAVVIGIHSITTNSWTSESLAYKIIVLELSDDDDDDDDDHDYKSEMYIMGYASAYEKHGDMMIRVRNQSNGKGKVKEVILEIDKSTEILDVQGNKVTVEQLLSSGKKVKVYFTADESSYDTVEGRAKKIVVQGKPVSPGKGHGNGKGNGNKKK